MFTLQGDPNMTTDDAIAMLKSEYDADLQLIARYRRCRPRAAPLPALPASQGLPK